VEFERSIENKGEKIQRGKILILTVRLRQNLKQNSQSEFEGFRKHTRYADLPGICWKLHIRL